MIWTYSLEPIIIDCENRAFHEPKDIRYTCLTVVRFWGINDRARKDFGQQLRFLAYI